MFFNVTPRKAAKLATRVAVYAGSMYGTETALNAVIGDPNADEPSLAIHTGSVMIGAVVGFEIAARTDRVIDKVADKHLARKAQKNEESSPLVAVAS